MANLVDMLGAAGERRLRTDPAHRLVPAGEDPHRLPVLKPARHQRAGHANRPQQAPLQPPAALEDGGAVPAAARPGGRRAEHLGRPARARRVRTVLDRPLASDPAGALAPGARQLVQAPQRRRHRGTEQ
eukprot:scaffold3963_cov90-Isochrysis_galbana.AAC.1